jgi:hypothetical protein
VGVEAICREPFNLLFTASPVDRGVTGWPSRRNLVHAVIYLIMSFFRSAFVFYLFGARSGILMVIVYAGAL